MNNLLLNILGVVALFELVTIKESLDSRLSIRETTIACGYGISTAQAVNKL